MAFHSMTSLLPEIIKWDIAAVENYLKQNNIDGCGPALVANQIDGQAFLTLNNHILSNWGIPQIKRAKILALLNTFGTENNRQEAVNRANIESRLNHVFSALPMAKIEETTPRPLRKSDNSTSTLDRPKLSKRPNATFLYPAIPTKPLFRSPANISESQTNGGGTVIQLHNLGTNRPLHSSSSLTIIRGALPGIAASQGLSMRKRHATEGLGHLSGREGHNSDEDNNIVPYNNETDGPNENVGHSNAANAEEAYEIPITSLSNKTGSLYLSDDEDGTGKEYDYPCFVSKDDGYLDSFSSDSEDDADRLNDLTSGDKLVQIEKGTSTINRDNFPRKISLGEHHEASRRRGETLGTSNLHPSLSTSSSGVNQSVFNLNLPPPPPRSRRRTPPESQAAESFPSSGFASASTTPLRCYSPPINFDSKPLFGSQQHLAVPHSRSQSTSRSTSPRLSYGSSRSSNISSSDTEVYPFPWYFGIDRKRAETLLKNTDNGTFLVRPSKNGGESATKTLSVQFNRRVFHLLIRRRPDGKLALGSMKENEDTFDSLKELVEHYQQHLMTLHAGSRSGNGNSGVVYLKRWPCSLGE